jgi:flavin reductase (DIM6/NTAB) family NADH-FMN oxidoreductase RutF
MSGVDGPVEAAHPTAMNPDDTYQILRTLTSPIVAITTRRGGKKNGMISDGAIRASIVPDVPRLGVFIHKFNFTHDVLYESGHFALHVLHNGQVPLVHSLGFRSGRDHDKLADVPHRDGLKTGSPILKDCFCWFECTVANVMDTGSSTFFMGDVVDAAKGPGAEPMEPTYLRDHLTAEMAAAYAANLGRAQDEAREASKRIVSAYKPRPSG